jgi:hypothetical protein
MEGNSTKTARVGHYERVQTRQQVASDTVTPGVVNGKVRNVTASVTWLDRLKSIHSKFLTLVTRQEDIVRSLSILPKSHVILPETWVLDICPTVAIMKALRYRQ